MQISQPSDRENRLGSPQPVHTPMRSDGVGTALRTAFLPRASDMPDEIADLIEKLR